MTSPTVDDGGDIGTLSDIGDIGCVIASIIDLELWAVSVCSIGLRPIKSEPFISLITDAVSIYTRDTSRDFRFRSYILLDY